MRRTVWALLLCLLAVSAGLVWYPYLSAERVSTPFEAAELLQQAGEEPVRFRSSEVDPDTVYRALEARWPYAFALHATVRANKTTDLRVEVSRPGRQAQAKAYAAALAADCITEDMTAEQKLRALHDALVRMCEYDVDTEQQEQPDGSTAPFSADGALLDHRAVCAGYGRAWGYGNYLIVDHGGGFSTLYAHCTSIPVSVGDTVTKGQTIAYVGTTGWSTGYHLHFEIRRNGAHTNPLNYL